MWSKPVSEIVNFIEPGIEFKKDDQNKKKKRRKKKKKTEEANL